MGKIFFYTMLLLLVVSIASVYLGFYKLAMITGFIFGAFTMGCAGLKI